MELVPRPTVRFYGFGTGSLAFRGYRPELLPVGLRSVHGSRVPRFSLHLRQSAGRCYRLCGLLLVFGACGCAGIGRDLHTVSELYRDARYEVAQAWCAALSGEYADMTPTQRVTYRYLSGMTAYRLSQPSEAQHELALAAHAVRESPDALRPEQLGVLYRTLEELSAQPPASP
jgi:hypothetical protein